MIQKTLTARQDPSQPHLKIQILQDPAHQIRRNYWMTVLHKALNYWLRKQNNRIFHRLVILRYDRLPVEIIKIATYILIFKKLTQKRVLRLQQLELKGKFQCKDCAKICKYIDQNQV